MYSYIWDQNTHGYKLTTQTGKFVANEIRPVFADELEFLQFDQHFRYDKGEAAPLMWALKNVFWSNGEKVAQLDKIEHDKPITATYFFDGKKKLHPVNVAKMLQDKSNIEIMDALVFDTLKRIKEMFVQYPNSISYIAFSGGKDSVVLLDLCHRVLPLHVPVVFSDTDMELPDTYKVWEKIQQQYPDRRFISVKSEKSAIENWKFFGPPSRVLRWCCSVHKSSPAILELRKPLISDSNLTSKFLCFVGVRGDESLRRSEYDDIGDGKKNNSQIQAMPILEWSAHELWLYIFQRDLIVNEAYKKGLQRVGCILCPMSSDRHTNFCQRLYKEEIAPFVKEIIDSSNRKFSSENDANNFVYHGGWHARNNGVFLKETLDIPISEQKNSLLFFTLPFDKHKTVLEWLKIFGRIEKANNELIKLPYNSSSDWICYTAKHGKINISIKTQQYSEQIIFQFSQDKPDKKLVSHLYRIIYKTVSCVACKVCQTECPHGALTFLPQIHVDEIKCVHCLQCNEQDNGCLRFHSKRNSKGIKMSISGAGNYQTFGLKPEWIAELSQKREDFRSTTLLGKNMIQSAPYWFREAKLTQDGIAIKPTKLLDVAEKYGFDSLILWYFIWMGLVNYSSLIKWFVCHASLNKTVDIEELDTTLSNAVSSLGTRKSALSSLNNLFKNSPLSVGDVPLVRLGMKGKQVRSLTRLPVVPHNLVVLYGLYLMGQLTKRSSFTVREMMGGDFEMPCVSPLYAFGIEPAEFQRICNGLSSKYPEFLSVSFTLGLDEVRLNDQKTIDDVLDLILTC
ncbi:MAG: phosphoadenosine phosphosulfate reductase family protein [Planctomycetaceae bacterium]|jgi:3'-phosphoadenosine 5'-phosphosulfate sulfotransferase (PAPS reductase)/FAD synthetase/ferredoxin|nr:phosphoadenosine phosphosulfate reductase family protein [Planctomycetaceae bacterium]